MFEYTIPLNPITKKNHSRIVKINGHLAIIPSREYKDFENACIKYLKPKPETPIEYPCSVKCKFYMAKRTRVDLANLLNSIDDILVTAGILADDNSRILFSHDGSYVFYDKENPRVEIKIVSVDADINAIWKLDEQKKKGKKK